MLLQLAVLHSTFYKPQYKIYINIVSCLSARTYDSSESNVRYVDSYITQN